MEKDKPYMWDYYSGLPGVLSYQMDEEDEDDLVVEKGRD